MTPLVGLLGATGYTGRLTAAELHRRGLAARLGGRSAQRLTAVADYGTTVVVDTTDPAALRQFCAGLDVLITCVGPFAVLGEPVLQAALDTGVPYLDSTGEPDFMARAYAAAAGAAVPVLPAAAFDYVPGDLAAALAVAGLRAPSGSGRPGEEPTDLLVGYRLSGWGASRGTARSALGALGTVQVRPRVRRLPFPDRPSTGLTVPWGEQLTVPRWLPDGPAPEVALALPPRAAAAAPVLARALSVAAALGPVTTPLLARAVERLPEGPSPEQRAAATAAVLAVATGGSGRVARVLVEVRDIYLLTAVLLAEYAVRLAAPGAPTGPLTPAQAAPPAEVVAALAADPVSAELLTVTTVDG